MSEVLVPAKTISTEIRVSNSRFIATIGPAFSTEQARATIENIKTHHTDAAHNVSLYIIGHGASLISHTTDDGEPPGTAGRPALSVLQGSNLRDAVLVITRYFGGTKLGTGGLVKAYTEAARSAIDKVPKAKKVIVHTAALTCSYSLFEKINILIEKYQGWIQEKKFTDQVQLSFSIPRERFAPFELALQDLSRGEIQARISVQDQTALIPIPKKD